ncbi:MAG TPA: type 2 lanthipeptide synthetase LanM family protein [Ktedonobacteraceae bacterium]|nr:type 2 lanthipeptide synthetase LanM family protein [Ktedonobacteraceae bacterium]
MNIQEPLASGAQLSTTILQSPNWYRAFSLAERAVLYRTYASQGADLESLEGQKARRRLQEWKTQRPFEQGTLFAERLAQDSLSEDELLSLLSQPVATLQEAYLRTASEPAWMTTLREAFQENARISDEIPWSLEETSLAHYLKPLLPLLKHSVARLNPVVQTLRQQYASLPFEARQILPELFLPLSEHILATISKVFVLEMHIARLEGKLSGETSEERFQHFIQHMSQEGNILALLEEYPVLARQIVIALDHWVAYTREFLEHLCADWPRLCALFAPEQEPGKLLAIQSGAGDAHRQGRSVLILTFESGLQLLYKPRSLALDQHFQHLLTWLNAHGAQPPFNTINVLDRGTYGWSEFVRAQSCTTEEEVARFFQRQGSYLALLYACNAVDMHIENVIAVGEYPIFVDLEALFHPPMGGDDPAQPAQSGQYAVDNSVFRIGLLPCRIWSNNEAAGIDLSGMGGHEGQLTPFAVPRWEGAGTDQMRLVRQRVEIPGGQNRPRLHGEEVDILSYSSHLLHGFECMYRLLQEQRELLIAEVLPDFAGDEIRLLFRPTRRYAHLLRESFHPDLLQDALARDRFFDQLWREVEMRPFLAKVLAAERRDLWRGDIPFFSTCAEGHMLFTSDREVLENIFPASSLDLVRQRLRSLDAQDMARQCWIIEAALSTLMVGPERVTGQVLEIKPAVRQPCTRADLIQAACAAGDRLEALAMRSASGASWLGVSAIDDQTWSLLPTDIDLYNGTSGIALFLGYLGAMTGEARYTELAQNSLRVVQALTSLQRKQVQRVKLGTFNGLGSTLYVLTHLGVLWHDPGLLREARDLVTLLPPLIEQDQTLDIVGGVAGCILALLGLYRQHPDPMTLQVACQCGDRLLATAQTMKQGMAWKTVPTEKPLGGFAHGTAGIALSLLHLASMSGKTHYRQVALEALAYDRSLYQPADQNWADLRTFAAQLARGKSAKQQTAETGRAPMMVAWCHGAAGIGLGRVGSLPFLDDEQVHQEIDIAIQTTVREGLKDNHSLCHGALGNLDLLVTATQKLDNARYRTLLAETTSVVLESIHACGWVAGVPLGIETPGFMTGLAGMGYELLRLAEPACVPSVLLLEPPCAL